MGRDALIPAAIRHVVTFPIRYTTKKLNCTIMPVEQTAALREISSSHGGEYDVQNCLLVCTAVRTSETSVDNHFTRQYIPEDNSEHQLRYGSLCCVCGKA
jgi:hypothetical protein